jgi:hypothetical protein
MPPVFCFFARDSPELDKTRVLRPEQSLLASSNARRILP